MKDPKIFEDSNDIESMIEENSSWTRPSPFFIAGICGFLFGVGFALLLARGHLALSLRDIRSLLKFL